MLNPFEEVLASLLITQFIFSLQKHSLRSSYCACYSFSKQACKASARTLRLAFEARSFSSHMGGFPSLGSLHKKAPNFFGAL